MQEVREEQALMVRILAIPREAAEQEALAALVVREELRSPARTLRLEGVATAAEVRGKIVKAVRVVEVAWRRPRLQEVLRAVLAVHMVRM